MPKEPTASNFVLAIPNSNELITQQNSRPKDHARVRRLNDILLRKCRLTKKRFGQAGCQPDNPVRYFDEVATRAREVMTQSVIHGGYPLPRLSRHR